MEERKILRVARSISAPEATVIDVEGRLLLPGFIGAHTRFDLDVQHHNSRRFLLRQPVSAAGAAPNGGGFCLPE